MKKITSLVIFACILIVGILQIPLQANTNEQSNTITTGMGVSPSILNEVTVSTPAELKTAIEEATEDTTILLSASFPTVLTAVMTVTVTHDFNILVDGQGIELAVSGNVKHLNLTSTGAGKIGFTNIHFIGNSIIGGDGRPTQGGSYNGGGVSVTNSAATLTGGFTFDNVEFKLISGGALRVGSSTRITIDHATFDSNSVSGYNGGAIGADSSPKEFILRNSTLKNNISNWQGYDGGAVIVTNVKENLEISNTTFIDNANLAHRGGAIALKFQGTTSANAKVKISDSYFGGNVAQNYGTAKAMADGGAISVFDLPEGAEFLITGTTFTKNTATDDGGALLLQGVKNAKFNIENSTFYENSAFGEGGDTGKSGGAIQAFANGAAFDTTYYNFVNNTFTKNTAKTFVSTQSQQGGAIAGSGGAARTARGTFTNNIIIGNDVLAVDGTSLPSSRYRNVSMTTTAASNAGNYGLDNNSVITTTTADIFGNYPVPLSEDYSSVQAGNSYTGSTMTVPTVPIIPNDGVVGLANEGGVSTGATVKDARGIARDVATPDSGAVEIAWVKYDANAGEFTATELTTYIGKEYYVAANPTTIYDVHYDAQVTTVKSAATISRQDRTFVEWNTAADGSGTTYTPGDVLTQSENLTLYAIWAKAALYHVTYNGNGATSGSVPTDLMVYAEDEIATVKTKNTLEKTGYTFIGWNTAIDGTGTAYLPDAELTIMSDVTLYAQWSENPPVLVYTVTYDGNGQTAGSVPTDLTDYLLNELALVKTVETLVKAGYTFSGWNTAADGTGTTYLPNAELTMTGDVTLYAQWSENPPVVVYTVTYDGNGQTAGIAPLDVTDYSLNELALVKTVGTLVKAGYTFSGWNTAADGSGTTYLPNAELTMTGDVTLYAQWSENPPTAVYKVTYDGNGQTAGSVPVDLTDYLLNQVAVVQTQGTLERTDYTFSGWNTAADGSGTTYLPNAELTMTGNVTLYAQWSENRPQSLYVLSYNGNNQTAGTAPVDSQTYAMSELAVVQTQGTLEKAGYTFSGWNTAADGTGTNYLPNTTVEMMGDIKLYAQWRLNEPIIMYKLVYDGNGQTAGTAPQDAKDYFEAEHAIVQEKGTLERANYTFAGWNTMADGSGTHYDPATELVMTKQMTLYAEWSEDKKEETTVTPEETTKPTLPETGEQSQQLVMLGSIVMLGFGALLISQKRYLKK